MNITQIATDAFGNALGNSLVESVKAPDVMPVQEVLQETTSETGSALPDWWPDEWSDSLALTSSLPTAETMQPQQVRAGDYKGSLERIARDQLGPNATQREINSYVGQLFEVNGITNARTIQPEQMITLPDANTAAATGGLQLYGKDIALGLQQQAQRAALAQAASERYAQYSATDNASTWSFKEASMAQRQLDDMWAAGFSAASSGAVNTPAEDRWNIGTRLAGAAQVLGGLGGAALSSTAIVAGAAGSVPTGGVSLALSALGYGGLVVSADQVSTGLRTLISGQPQRSLTGQGIEYATGASPQWSEVGASMLTLSPAAGEAYLINQSTRALGAYNAAVRAGYGESVAGANSVGISSTKTINPLSPVLELDVHGNEILYRTMSEQHYELFLRTGKLPPTTETSISPSLAYASKYDGVTVKIAVAPGTSAALQDIGIAANNPAAAQFPNMSTQTGAWMQTNARFKVEGGQMTTQLGQGKAINIFNQNIVDFELVPNGGR